tara:strand:- start:60 stop:281 length:222 start_codon:yes stop_codon:yes gene_type:complete
MSKKINELLAKNQEIGKEIDDIQSQCKHVNQKLKQVPERLDSTITVIRWVCVDCKKILHIPNKEEIDNYLLKE